MILKIVIPDDRPNVFTLITRLLAENDVRVVVDEPADLNTMQVGTLVLNPRSHEVFVEGRLVYLNLKEFRLLHLLMRNINTVVSHQRILQDIWGYTEGTSLIKGTVLRLRQKLGSAAAYVRAVRNCGYMLKSPPRSEMATTTAPSWTGRRSA